MVRKQSNIWEFASAMDNSPAHRLSPVDGPLGS
jgi:hypothetical protein